MNVQKNKRETAIDYIYIYINYFLNLFTGFSVWSKWLSPRAETKRQRDICVEVEGLEKAMRWSRDVCVEVEGLGKAMRSTRDCGLMFAFASTCD